MPTRLELQVGGDVEAEAPKDNLDAWIKDLGTTIDEQRQQQQQHEQHSADTKSMDKQILNVVTRVLLMQARDRGQQQLAATIHHFCTQVKPQHTLGQWEPGLLSHEVADVQHAFAREAIPVQQYYYLQQQLTESMAKINVLKRQWMDYPIQPAEIEGSRKIMDRFMQSEREAHGEWLSLMRRYTEQTWKVRVDLVEAYRLLVQDTVGEFEREGAKIVDIYKHVRTELDHHIATAESNEFHHQWKQLYDNFRFWMRSISEVLPASLRFQQDVDALLMSCDHGDDPCCLKRVNHIRDQLHRIHSVLQVHRHTEQHHRLTSTALDEELKMTTTEWTQTQAQLDQTQRELQNLATRRASLWSQGASIADLENLEQRQRELESKQTVLTDKIAPLRMAMERVRQQTNNISHSSQLSQALQQCEDWRIKFENQQRICEKEADQFAQGRGVLYRARDTASDETIRTLESLYVTAQQKIDGAGVALVRYGLIVLQNMAAGLLVQSKLVQDKQRIAHESLIHHIQRLAVNQPGVAELLNQLAKSENDIRRLQDQLEELQLHTLIHDMVQKSLRGIISPASAHD